jgi:2'-5' RNA ligase
VSTLITNEPSSVESPQGRRVLVAVVTGDAGQRIQAWREEHDPIQAQRLPPHATLCYWVPQIAMGTLERQVLHAFSEPVSVRLGRVGEFDNGEHTFYVHVQDTAPLDEARRRLHDGTHCPLPPLKEWTWHITCVRDSRERDLDVLRQAADRLECPSVWQIDTVACLELRGNRYQPLATWRV